MALNIKNATAERPVRPAVLAEIAELQAFVRFQPDRDTRPPDEIVGYDEFGLPT